VGGGSVHHHYARTVGKAKELSPGLPTLPIILGMWKGGGLGAYSSHNAKGARKREKDFENPSNKASEKEKKKRKKKEAKPSPFSV